jgi:hypothetical protein
MQSELCSCETYRAGFKGGAAGEVSPEPPQNRSKPTDFIEKFSFLKITKS